MHRHLPAAANPPPEQQSALSDLDLLQRIAAGRGRTEAAHAAYAEFHRRHVDFVYGILRRTFGSTLGEDGVQDFVVEVLLHVLLRAAGSFRGDGSVRAWLCTVAQRLVYDQLRSATDPKQLGRADAFWVHLPDREIPNLRLTTLARFVREFVAEELNEKQRHVLRWWLAWFDPANPRRKPPAGAVDAIAREIDVKPGSVRQLRGRALQRIRGAVDAAFPGFGKED